MVKSDKEEEKPKNVRYELKEIATQTGMIIQDNQEEREVSQLELQILILNKLDRIEKSVA